MRFFRIPAFTGIEVHRDDADRGSLRVVEGCVPHGPGGLRSGPVWETLATVSMVSTGDENHLSAMDDGKGNSIMFASRKNEVHDIKIVSTENTDLDSLGTEYEVVSESPYVNDDAILGPVGNRLYSFGDGTAEAVMSGKGPIYRADSGVAGEDFPGVFPDTILYRQEWSRFPDCQFFVQGPKKTIFAAGNPKDPLVVYISEPAGMTQPIRDSPYSTELNNQEPGLTNDNVQHPYLGGGHHGENEGLSTVRILGSNATRISALSTRGDKIVVHTDKGCHILYAPTGDQASTGYRTEQVAATNTSAAVNAQTVAGDGGTQPFWLGFDGQIYKDEAAVRGAEDFKSYSDPQQASWKAKGKWEVEHPANLENSFATYDPQSGMYWVFIESTEQPLNVRRPLFGPANLSACQPDYTGVCPSGCSALLGNVPLPVPAGNWRISDSEFDTAGVEYWDGTLMEMSADPNSLTFLIDGVLFYSRYTYDVPGTGERFDLVRQINEDVRLDYYASANSTPLFAYVGSCRWDSVKNQPEWSWNSGFFMAAREDQAGICFVHGLPAGSVPPANGPTSLTGLQVAEAPANGPTNLLGSQAQQAPTNGPTNLTGTQATSVFKNPTHTETFPFPYHSNVPNYVNDWTIPQGMNLGHLAVLMAPGPYTDLIMGNLTVSVAHPKFQWSSAHTIQSTTSIHHSELPMNYTVTSGSESCVVTLQAQYNSPPPVPVDGPTALTASQASSQAPASGPTLLAGLEDYPICVSNTGGFDGTYEIDRYISGGSKPAWVGPSNKYIFWSNSTSSWHLGGLGQTSGPSLIDTGDSSDWPWQCTWSTISITTGDCAP